MADGMLTKNDHFEQGSRKKSISTQLMYRIQLLIHVHAALINSECLPVLFVLPLYQVVCMQGRVIGQILRAQSKFIHVKTAELLLIV